MKITNTEVYGFEASLRGMRNPMNSWHLQDTSANNIGVNDMDLAKRLIKAGPEHCKFLRQIQVWADFDMPLYWWSEFDTYKFNTKNSCSTMHKLFNTKKEIELIERAGVIIEDKEYTKEDLQRCESEITSYIMSHSSKNGDINKLQNQYSNVFRIIVK